MAKYWLSAPPRKCDICGGAIGDTFTDGKTRSGPWAIMCDPCLPKASIGRNRHHGEGLGQHYKKQPDGKWLKIA